MKGVPTDLKILNAIYDRYYDEFSNYEKGSSSRSTKMYVPIDTVAIAKGFRVDEDLIFGRLYYHLEHKYGYVQDDGARVHFFAMRIGGDHHCVHFPYLEGVLADLQQENRKFNIMATIAAFAVPISLIAILISAFAAAT